MTLQITVYSKSACPQCESAKMLLKSRSLPYEEIKIDDEAERLAFYAKCGPSVRQMPQIEARRDIRAAGSEINA